MKLQHKHIVNNQSDYQLVLDEYYRIIQISREVTDLFSFYDTPTAGGVYTPISEAVTEKIQRIIYRWLEQNNEEIFNLITNKNKVISLRASVNEVIGKCGTTKYILHLKNTENDSVLKKKNRELKNELESFVYRTSHDLRGPLLSVLGCLQLIKLDKGRGLTDYLNRIEDLVQNLDFNMKEITRQVFNKGIHLQYRQIEISQIIDEVINNFKLHPNYEQVSVKIQLETKYSFQSDATLFKMVITNLMSNAFNFIDPKKDYKQIVVRIRVEPFKLLLEVEDNGIGITADAQPRIYQMFFRGTNNSKGVGLGLYMAKTAIEDLRGDISFTSNAKTGTYFKVVIPNLVGATSTETDSSLYNNQLLHLN